MKKTIIDKKILFKNRYDFIFNPINNNWLEDSYPINYFCLIPKNSEEQKNFLSFAKEKHIEYEIIYDFIFLIHIKDKDIISKDFLKDYEKGIMCTLSSIIPIILLDAKPQDRILDLCAAPGIKSSLSKILYKDIDLTSVEKDSSRYFRMTKLFESLSFLDIKAINLDSKKLNTINIKYDKIICDLPCSSEGEMIKDNNFAQWSAKLIDRHTNIQKALISKAINICKTNGIIMYSTCTIAPEENELIIDWALKRFSIHIEDIDLSKIKDCRVLDGITTYRERELFTELKKSKRIYPSNKYEGFFVAKLVKDF